jgi:signal transduction histidine kinase/HAMP domain-containing protein
MRIKTRLRLNTYISLGAVMLILLSLLWSLHGIVIVDRNMDFVDETRKVNFERILIRDEYLLYQEERAKTQWLAKTEQLRDLLAAADKRFNQERDKEFLLAAHSDFDATVSGMSRVMEGHARQSLGVNKSFGFSDAEMRLISQVYLHAYSLRDNIGRLHESVQRAEVRARNRGAFILVISMLVAITAIIINSTTISRTLAMRVEALNKGVERIGSGDLDYRVTAEGNDELTALALASNEMAAKLKQSYVSVKNLELEVDDRKRAEEALQESEAKLSEAQKMAQLGHWRWNVKTGAVEWSEEVYKIFRLDPKTFTPQIDSLMLLSPWPEEHERDKELIRKAMETHETGNFEQRFLRPDGSTGHYYSTFRGKYDEQGNLTTIVGTAQDITERKQLESKLESSIADLQRSNEELEQFAYVASHDLQEPLRMVASYTQLLAERYENQLDDKARKFIHYAVDGAVRMRLLINDLLVYSRVSTKGKPPELVDAHAVLGEAIKNLGMNIDETQAIITNDELPTVRADAFQMVQLLQNLISNSLKFRGEGRPHIHISSRDEGTKWLFSIKDNGIGIDPQYADKIFVIFQRLHTRAEYPGSGIGLAICKKIVERHGGRIWFESELGNGTTFYFTIPK